MMTLRKIREEFQKSLERIDCGAQKTGKEWRGGRKRLIKKKKVVSENRMIPFSSRRNQRTRRGEKDKAKKGPWRKTGQNHEPRSNGN